MLYIIDGYNVMHAMEKGSGIARGDLEEKRHEFIESVISQSATSGDETFIVFDSTVAKAPESYRIPQTAVTVYFASASESADVFIGKLVRQHLASPGGRVRVVSADWEVQKGVMQSRVERIPPRHYIAELKKIEKKLEKSSKRGRIRWKLEHKLDVETLRKLEELRRGER